MVRKRVVGLDQGVGLFPGQFHVEQAVAVNVGEFAAMVNEANSTVTMGTNIHVREAQGFCFEGFDGAKAFAMEKSRPGQEHRIEALRREWNARKKMKMPDHKLENHGSFSA